MEISPLERTPAAENEWDRYVDNSPASAVYHLAAFRSFIESATGHRASYLEARRDGLLCGVLPLVELKSRLFGHYFVSLPYFNHCGILADDDEARAALARAAAQQVKASGASHVEIRHIGTASGIDWKFKTTKDEMLLALPSTVEAMLTGFRSKLRSQIKRAGKEGMHTRVGGAELLEPFYSVFARNMRDLGTPVYAQAFFEEFFARFSDRLWIVLCEAGGVPVAAGVLIGWRGTMEIPWASSLREHNHLAPNMLLYWTALQHAINCGYQTFDFGRSTRGAGTWKFKEQWGAKPTPLYWYYFMQDGIPLPELNPQNAKYRLAISVWRRLPLSITNRVGPYIVKNLP